MSGPRVLLILQEQWPRARLRAELRERGYDAAGAPTLADALVYPADGPESGPVRLVLVDHRVLEADGTASIERVRARHPAARFLLLTRSRSEAPRGTWAGITRGVFTVDDLLRDVARHLPLDARGREREVE